MDTCTGEQDSADRHCLLQIELIEDETGNPDPKATFRLIIIQTELERFKYLVRSFLRARLAKVCHELEEQDTFKRRAPETMLTRTAIQIDKYTLHSLTDSEVKDRLSSSEQQYAQAHTTILHGHFGGVLFGNW